MISNEIFLFFNRFKKKKENHALRSIHQPEDLKCTPHRNSAVRSWGAGIRYHNAFRPTWA